VSGLILASGSPRRRDILSTLGIEFEVAPTDVDERSLEYEDGDSFVRAAALAKLARALEVGSPVGATVLAADTMVFVDERRLGKPIDDDEALRMLRLLRGRRHDVRTAVAIGRVGQGVLDCRVYNTGRSKMRQFFKEFEKRGTLAALSVPPDSVRALVARAAAVQPADRALPRTYREWVPQIGRAPEGTRTPGELIRESLEFTNEPAAVRRAAELVEKGEIGPWPPEPEALSALAEKLDSIATSSVRGAPTLTKSRYR